MVNDIVQVYETKIANFVDFGDVYLSFIFNLLSNSLQIKVSSETMVTAVKLSDTVSLVKNIAKICRIVLDFDSYQNKGVPIGTDDMGKITAYFKDS